MTPPKIISVCNLKGGAGKSTIAVNIACAIAHRHEGSCVLVDADKQATAAIWGLPGAERSAMRSPLFARFKNEL